MRKYFFDSTYLIKVISENYPYLQIHKRKNNFDWIENSKNLMQECLNVKNEFEYFSSFFLGLNHHAKLISKDSFPFVYSNYKNAFSEFPYYRKWFSTLNSQKVLNSYKYSLEKMIANNLSNLEKNEVFCKSTFENFVYIKVPNFNHTLIKKEGELITNFLRLNSDDTKTIIFDIRGNSGGSSHFWRKIIMDPLRNSDYSFDIYTLFKGGKVGLAYLKEMYPSLDTIDNLDINLKFESDRKLYSYFFKDTISIGRNPEAIKYSKIIVIMDKSVFSASETFVSYCKRTHFATLIGQRSSGDGLGLDPILVRLPNSGLVFKIPLGAALNADGSMNFEEGTTPDIIIDPEVDPINYIKENQSKF